MITFSRGEGSTVLVRFPYDDTVKELLKDVVPYFCRQWNVGGNKAWSMGEKNADDFAAALTTRGYEHDWRKTTASSKADTSPEGGFDAHAYATAILHNIPPDQRGAVFRAMARILYPDMYGRNV